MYDLPIEIVTLLNLRVILCTAGKWHTLYDFEPRFIQTCGVHSILDAAGAAELWCEPGRRSSTSIQGRMMQKSTDYALPLSLVPASFSGALYAAGALAKPLLVSILAGVFLISVAMAQRNNASANGSPNAGSAPSSSASGATGSLAGVNWVQSTWSRDLTLPPTKARVVACYTFQYGNSSAQPFILQPAKSNVDRAKFELDCKRSGTQLNETDPKAIAQCTAEIKKGEATPKWSPCRDLDAEHPILMGQTLVIGLIFPSARHDRIKLLNLNVTTQAANAINATPVRPSFAATLPSQSANLAPGPYYLTWPNEIPGDTIVTVNVNAAYTPPIPGDVWSPETFYVAGSTVSSRGHYFMAKNTGVSAENQTDEPSLKSTVPAQVLDGQVTWVDAGTSAPGSSGPGAVSAALWLPHHDYLLGQSVYNPNNGHYYTNLANATRTCGAAAAAAPCATSGSPPVDPFSAPTIMDGTVEWQDRGQVLETGVTPISWAPHTAFDNGTWIVVDAHHYFKAIQPSTVAGHPRATSGDVDSIFRSNLYPSSIIDGEVLWTTTTTFSTIKAWSPHQGVAKGDNVIGSDGQLYVAQNDGGTGAIPSQPYFASTPSLVTTSETSHPAGTVAITWEDIGTSLPSSVAPVAPADQVVNLLNLPYAQSHSLSYYNLAAGVMYSRVQSRNFGFVSDTGTTPASTVAKQTSRSRTVDPALMFTVYPYPVDAETHCGLHCLWTTPPGFSLGLSLANPSSSFYVGASFELLRNMQLVLGYNWAKEAYLPTGIVQGSSAINSGTPVTSQRYTGQIFLGLTFNISGFVQSLFGGGGGGGASGKSSSPSSGQ
jgi:hypothetical protein